MVGPGKKTVYLEFQRAFLLPTYDQQTADPMKKLLPRVQEEKKQTHSS